MVSHRAFDTISISSNSFSHRVQRTHATSPHRQTTIHRSMASFLWPINMHTAHIECEWWMRVFGMCATRANNTITRSSTRARILYSWKWKTYFILYLAKWHTHTHTITSEDASIYAIDLFFCFSSHILQSTLHCFDPFLPPPMNIIIDKLNWHINSTAVGCFYHVWIFSFFFLRLFRVVIGRRKYAFAELRRRYQTM